MEELLTMVDFNNDEDQVSNPEEVKYEDCSIGDSSDSSIKVSTKHIQETSKQTFTMPFDKDSDEEDSAYESNGSKSSNGHFSQTPSKEQQSESKLPKQKESKRLRSVRLKR
jgi:hypothetical protein